jgi:GAG-pre-integrase domain
MICEYKIDNGLYYLNISDKAFVANNIEENKLWHGRVGHATDNVLHKLMPLKKLNNSYCDICHFSKKT